MAHSTALVFAALTALAGCTGDQSPGAIASSAVPETRQAPPPMPGSDQDAHGCKASAGYTWCARSSRCERPWELAASKDLENSPQAFKDWCDTPADQATDGSRSD